MTRARPAPALRALLAAALATLLAGCPPSDPGPFRIRLALDPNGGCASDLACDAYPMSCETYMRYRILDLEAEDSDNDRPINLCRRVVSTDDEAPTVCGLGDVDPVELPPHRVRIDVAAWRSTLITQPDINGNAEVVCPSAGDVFTADGALDPDFEPVPAFAGSAVFDVASDAAEVVVPLACAEPAQLDADECRGGPRIAVTARVADIETSLDLTEQQAAAVEVRVGVPSSRFPPGGGTVFTFDRATATVLELQPGTPPTFVEQVDGASLGEVVCTHVDEPVFGRSPALVCESGVVTSAARDVRGLLVSRAVLDQILAALGTEFPAGGLVIGRVIDAAGAPLAGATVAPSAGTVSYLSEDRTSFGGTATSASGYFVSTNVPFRTALMASHPDGRAGTAIGGLVQGQVTAVVIQLLGP